MMNDLSPRSEFTEAVESLEAVEAKFIASLTPEQQAQFQFLMSVKDQKLIEQSLSAAHDWTGLLNKEHSQTEGSLMFSQTANGQPAVLVGDMGSFKQVNDKLGHVLADQVLLYVGTVLSDNFDKGDIICHFGGDEYVVFVKNATADMLERKIKSMNANMKVTLADGTIVYPRLDLGYALTTQDEKSDLALKRADNNLIAGKKRRIEENIPGTTWRFSPSGALQNTQYVPR